MVQEIDKGIILTQQKIKVESKDTLHTLNEKCYDISPSLLLKTLDKIKNNDFSSVVENNGGAYYPFPEKDHWDVFRLHGGRVI